MSRVQLSPEALSDLDGIWDYIASDNVKAADDTVEKIGARLISYVHQPLLGELRPELGEKIRCFSVGWYVVFYRPAAECIEVIRILHGARDVRRL